MAYRDDKDRAFYTEAEEKFKLILAASEGFTPMSRQSDSTLADIDSLWQFALTLYAKPGIADITLRLQDEARIDVPELLWWCWQEWRTEHVAENCDLTAIRDWQHTYTHVLRQLRRSLKPIADDIPRLRPLREEIKHAELETERETLHRLAELKRAPGTPSEQQWQQWHGDITTEHKELIGTLRGLALKVTLE